MHRKPFGTVLVANRGEIAVRIHRACRELGLKTIQVYSEADADSLAVHMADRAVCIGPAHSGESYLRAETIIAAALKLGAGAIHPGYGFLSENAAFARMVAEAGLVFIGPSPEAISLMGNKATARQIAIEAGVPVTPGSDGALKSAAEAIRAAERIGYPVILKAVSGGGGRGMRVIHRADELGEQLEQASQEARAAFGDESIYIEKFLPRARHVEVQVLADRSTALHLGERDCSVQRRNQKLLEESPSPALNPAIRERIGDAAIRLAQYVGYTSAGTVEYILDPSSGEFFFMEMNTRIQVEHPVTEFVTGIDIVKEQIRIAQGHLLRIRQLDIRLHGHAIECRVNAEDPEADFAPCPGRISALKLPGGPGVRVDSHIFEGYRVPLHYDSLVAKLITWGANREEAIARMLRSLAEIRMDGVKTTIGFHLWLLQTDAFRRGDLHTRFVDEAIRSPT